jgi:hypothetical protein
VPDLIPRFFRHAVADSPSGSRIPPFALANTVRIRCSSLEKHHNQSESALTEQRDLLLSSSLPKDVIDDLLVWTVVVASRYFPNELVRSVFDKELEMLKDFPEVQRWMEESRLQGEQAGLERGGLQRARLICKRTLMERFGPLSREAEEYLDTRTADELGDLVVRSLRAPDLAALGIPF